MGCTSFGRYVTLSGGFDAVLRRAAVRHVREIARDAESRRRHRGDALTVVGGTRVTAAIETGTMSIVFESPPVHEGAGARAAELQFVPVVPGRMRLFRAVPMHSFDQIPPPDRMAAAAPSLEHVWFDHAGSEAASTFCGGDRQTVAVRAAGDSQAGVYDSVVLITPQAAVDPGGAAAAPVATCCPVVIAVSVGCDARPGVHRAWALVGGRLRLLEKVFGDDSGEGRRSKCVVCWEERPLMVLMPCRHSCVCNTCLPQLGRACPLCRERIATAYGAASDG